MTQKEPWYSIHSPEIGPKFREFYAACNDKGVLDKKTKELLMVALACTHRCGHCTRQHIQRALDAGASKGEVSEALLIAAVEGAGTQLYWCKDSYEQLLGSDEG
jgi:AhpD family alkylhydroperoxidase